MNKEITEIAVDTIRVVITHLWSTMIFILVMTVVTGTGGYLWTAQLHSRLSGLISYWIWFVCTTVVTGFAVWAFVMDARIKMAQPHHHPRSGRRNQRS
jgi:hypothetical protein